MAIQMTRAEYEAKYGTKPEISSERGFFNTTSVGQEAKKLGTNFLEAVKNPGTVIPERLKSLTPGRIISETENGELVANKEQAERVLDFAMLFDAGSAGAKVGKELTGKLKNTINNISIKAPQLDTPLLRGKIANFFSNDIDEKAATILKETPTQKFDEYVKIAQDAVADPRKQTPFEVVGDRLQDATLQLQNQIKSFSQQKKAIISQAKTGLVDFTKQTGNIILEIQRSVGDSQIGQTAIQKLKSVKTKLDADNVIDEIQDMIYTGNQNMTIPKGSLVDKKLRLIIGKFNSELKKSLPESYSVLNTKISNRIDIVGALNRALGETVDGVPTRGASMIKQFFSPSGTKTKELFAYIKKNTGIDLAQDATIARFTMEMFDDARARMLLDGIPSNPMSIINQVVDFTADKIGIGRGLQNKVRENTIEKARDITK